MTKTDMIPDCKRFNLFSALPALLLLTCVIFLTILPNAWSETAPVVNSVTFTSTGPYKVGDSITVEVRFDQDIQVSGTPQLTLVIGATGKTADRDQTLGASSESVYFSYTVVAGDTDTDGVSVKANSLDFNGGSIRSRDFGNEANLAHSAKDGGTGHAVDTTAPTVSSVAFSSTGPYKIASNIDVKVTMSENVNVVTAENGTPSLTILIGTTEKTAKYNSGTGTSALVFRYTLAAGDGDDANGPAVKVNSLALNSGTIKDPAGNAATLTHSAVTDAGSSHAIDATAPTVSSLAFSSTGPYKLGSNIDVTLTMSENVTVDTTDGTPSLTFVVGTTERTAAYNSGTGTTSLVFRYTAAAGDTDTDGVAVKVNSLALNSGTMKDAAGNTATLTHSAKDGGSSHTVDTTVPTVSSVAFLTTGPYNAGDHITVMLDLSESVDITGTPQITFVLGTTEKTAEDTRGNIRTTTLVFKYTIVAGDTDTDGFSVKANSLSLNGGTINDLTGNALTLTHSALAGVSAQAVDTTIPTVSSLAFSSTGPYANSENIDVTLTMSENVNVTGTPQLTFIVGTTEKTASYTSGTGTTALVFRYAVTTGDTDTDGVAVKVNSLALNSGTMKDAAGNDLTLTHSALANGGNSHIVDTTAPTVSSLAFTSTGPYKTDSNIDVTVTMSENVTVDTTGGTPSLTLRVGSADKTASYNSGSGTTALVFRYTVVANELDTDGASVNANSLSLNSGTMKDAAGNALTLTHSALTGDANQRVDAVKPYIVADSVSLTSTGPYALGEHIDIAVQLSESVTVTGKPRMDGIVLGTKAIKTYYHSGSGTDTLTFRYTVVAGDTDTDGITMTRMDIYLVNNSSILDGANNASSLTATQTLTANASNRVDTTIPTVGVVAFTGTGPYKAGSNIDLTLGMSENIDVTGTPQLTLLIGTTEKKANYNSGTGTNALVFRYTVAAGDTDTDGVSVKANSLALNSGTMKDLAGNALTLTHSALDGGDNQRVDTTIPTVSSLAFTSTGPYKVGGNIDVTVTTSENVTVDTTGGKPSLTFVVGTTEKTAKYHSGTGTTSLVFRYTVVAGDADTDGVAVKVNSLSLNSGTLKDIGGNDLTLTHSALANGGDNHRVDTSTPTVSSLAFTSIGTYSSESVIEVTVTMSEKVTVTGTPQLTLIIGTTEKKANYASGSGTTALVFKYTVATGDGTDTDGVSVKANSLALNGGTIKDIVNAATLTHAVKEGGVGHTVDTGLLKVNTISFSSTGPYKAADNIEVTVTTTKPVTVTGNATLTIVIGTTEKTASYNRRSGTHALVFRYIVAAADGNDTDGVSVKANSLTGGSIVDSANKSLNTNHDGVDGGTDHVVDTTAPTVTSVTFSGTGPYRINSTIDITVTMSENVTVDTTSGTPRLTLVVGTADKLVNYASGSGTTALVFQYTVTSADSDDDDGVAVKANSLDLNSGTIKDAVGNAATLTHDAVAASNSHRVDITDPQVSAVAFSSTGPYKAGSNIDVKLTMSEAITVAGTPQLTLVIGTAEKTANYNSGSGTSALIFRYTVLAGDTDTDGASVKVNSLALNGGTMQDSVGNNLTLTHTTMNGGNTHRVDTTAPTVSALAFTSTGPYSVGNNIDVKLTTSEAVDVDTTDGTPNLTLVVGTAEKTANYNSGTGTTALVFRYTVATGDTDTDGVTVKANSLTLNSGTLKDSVGNDLTRTHSAVDANNSQRVDTASPTVRSIAFTSTGPYNVGANIDVTLTTSKSITVVGTPQLTLVVGTTEKTANYNSGSGTSALVFRYTTLTGDNDTDGVSVKLNSLKLNSGTLKDSVGNDLTLTHSAADADSSHRVDSAAPTVSALAFTSTGPYNVGHNIDVTLTMNETVSVTGTPQLTIVIGTTERKANYNSGTGTEALIFRYTVVDADTEDTDGVSVKANSLGLNGGSIVDVLRNAATLTHVAVTDAGDSHRVDKTPPTVTSVEIASTGPYGIGSNIIVKATMSEVVNVIGTPRITIVLGTTERTAEYTSGTGTKVLLFQYTVQTGDADADGVSVKQDSLALTAPNRQSLSDGIRDNAENPADLTHNAVANAGNNHRVDTSIPTVSTIAFTSTGPYTVGANIDVTLTVSKSVTVTGTPTLTLEIGNDEKTASYHSGTGTTALVFRYTVVKGDTDADGASVIASSLALNSGSITDTSGSKLNLAHSAVTGDANQVVDTLPVIRSITFTSAGPYEINSNIDVTVTISKNVTVSGTPTLTLLVGNTEKTANYHSGTRTNALVFRYTVVKGDMDPDGVSVKANSLALNGGSITDQFSSRLTRTHQAVDGGVSHAVDTILPEVSSIAFVSTGPYSIGNSIEVAVTTTKDVTVTGNATLKIVIGNAIKTANYHRRSKTNALIFRYTVTNGDSDDTDGVSVRANSLSPNGGSIVDASNKALSLNHDGIDGGIGHRVETTLPTVRSLAFTSTGPYRVGDRIEVTATLSKNVTVTGTPTLTLIIGNTDRIINYHSGSGTSALIFQYTVTQSDTTNGNGISVRANSLALKGGSIRDAVGNALNLNHETILSSGSIHQVNTMLLGVNSVAFTSTGPYGSWDDIEVTVTTTKSVIVTGNATLKIVIGNREKTANYHSGSGTTALRFRYTVATGDGDDTNGISVRANSLSTNGGTIKDTFGNDLSLNHDAVADGGDSQRVDTTAPSVRLVAFTSTGPYGIGNAIQVTVTTSEAVQVAGAPTLTLIIGNREKTAQYLRGSHTDALVFRYIVATGDGDDPDGVSVKANSLAVNGSIITDLLGNNLDLKHNAVANGGDSQIVGTTVSGISSLAFTSTGPYKLDDTITITVQTTEKVTVTGIPRIPMIFGTNTRYANYVSGSGTTALFFQYTVVAGDEDTDGIEIAANALENNDGSTIKNNYHTDVNLSHAGVPANPNQIVDTTIPKVVSVDFGDTSNTYAVGDEIEVVVTFEETGVQVDPAADGTLPSVTLLLGSNSSRNSQKTAVSATYKESRPGSTKLVFTYTITEDTPMDVDGVQIKRDGLMIPNGTSIHDASGNPIRSSEAENGQLTILPRASTLVSSRPILPAITATSVIFNEFLNASSSKQDWVELRNLSETDIALGNWQITISTGQARQNNVVQFPDITLPAGQVLLLINTPHKDTRLALSKHFSYRYLLMPELRLPQNAFMLTLQNRAGAVMDIMGSYFAGESAPDTPIFEQDQAYAREESSISGYDATAWTLSGYHAGLGYDRNVPKETSPGTPGYLKPVSIPQSEIAPVSISEIMYVTGKSGKLPQWIELYNASKTRIISMRGWKLQLELSTEHDALHRGFSAFVIQDSLQILPNQTILIVTKNGRNSKHFPESRVYNLTQQHPDDIKKLSPEDEITGVTGFAVVLSDDRGNQVDIVGNLDGQSGTNDDPSWKLPNGLTQNGNRSSIIRQYEDGVPLTGTRKSSWFRASTIKRTVQTYWGHSKDAGNPGWKKGTALPVQLSSFKAERTDAGAVITWQTESELENAGFNILRSETKNGTFTVVNPKLIPGAGTTAERNTYQYVDTGTKPGQHYYYQLEDVSFNGIRQTLTTQRLRRNVSPVGQRLTTFGAIKKGDQ